MLTVSTKSSTDALLNVNATPLNSKKIDEKSQAEIENLKKRDLEVRQHEEAHKRAAAGLLTVGPKYEYRVGPDGKKYAVSGDVQIDIAEIPNNPEATVKKAQQIKRAALAPVQPSAQDKVIAAKATEMELKAKSELNQANTEPKEGSELANIISYDAQGNLKSDDQLATQVDATV